MEKNMECPRMALMGFRRHAMRLKRYEVVMFVAKLQINT